MAAMLTLNGKAVDLGFGVRIAQGREVMINSGGSWVSSGRRLDTDDWANIEIYVDFNNLKYGLGPDAPKSERSFSFRDNGGQFDGMRFKCYAGSFYVDNIKFEWTYDAQ
jgi:hypothetical protein